jgi:hypothetical protein
LVPPRAAKRWLRFGRCMRMPYMEWGASLLSEACSRPLASTRRHWCAAAQALRHIFRVCASNSQAWLSASHSDKSCSPETRKEPIRVASSPPARSCARMLWYRDPRADSRAAARDQASGTSTQSSVQRRPNSRTGF